MTTRITIPKMNMGMQEGTLSEWTVEDGAYVNAGQVIYVLEADKVSVEIESPVSGVIRILAEAGEDYPVGTPIADVEGDA